MFVSRRSTGPGRFLDWRVRLLGVAAILAVFGIGADQGWMVNLAIGVLAVSLVLGMIEGRSRGGGDDDEVDDVDDDDAEIPTDDAAPPR